MASNEKGVNQAERDVEQQRPTAPTKIGWYDLMFRQGAVTQEVIDHEYTGSGTEEDPYIVKWLDKDPRNPMQWEGLYKWVGVHGPQFDIGKELTRI